MSISSRLFVPSHSFAQGGHLRGMVPAVPGIKTRVLSKGDKSNLRMPKRSLEVIRSKRLQQRHPSAVERFEQRKRYIDRRDTRIVKLGPTVLVVGLYRGFIFSQRELEPAVAVQVAVGNVMHDLPNSPTIGAIRCVKLLG